MAADGWVVSNSIRGFQINGMTVYAGAGVPSNATGADGDIYLRSDGTILGTVIYRRAAGVWVGLGIA